MLTKILEELIKNYFVTLRFEASGKLVNKDKDIAHAQAEIMKCVPKQEQNVIETCCTCNCYKAGWNACRAEQLKRMEG